MWDVIVGGGGASGMVCALECAARGLSVLLLEKNKKLGRKLLLTGAGRCNLLNEVASLDDFPCGQELAKNVLAQWPTSRLKEYFQQLGLALSVGPDNRIFPQTDRAQSVVEVLHMALLEKNVSIEFGQRIEKLEKTKDGFVIKTTKSTFQGKHFVLAFGGQSYGRTGSSGEGYELARTLSHTIDETCPALVPLRAKLGPFHKLQGQKWRCGLTLYDGQRKLCHSVGDVMWTSYGLSGLAILDVTAKAPLPSYEGLRLTLNLFPHFRKPKDFLRQRASNHPQRTLKELFVGLLPKKIVKVCLPLALRDNQLKVPVKELDLELIDKVAEKLSSLSMTLTGATGWEQAQVTAGGVSLSEVDLQSCQSKKMSRVYIIGEVLNAHGLSGGYNLHLAWATAMLAAHSISKEC